MATTQYTPVLVVSTRSLFPVEVKVSERACVCDNLVMSSFEFQYTGSEWSYSSDYFV